MASLKEQFPFFAAHPHTVYLDSAATAQMPQAVIDASVRYFSQQHASVGRGLYDEAVATTTAVEEARDAVRAFLHAPKTMDVIWTSSTTIALNQLAWALQDTVKKGDTIVTFIDNHHANLIPWQRLATQTGAQLYTVSITQTGEIDQKSWHEALQKSPRVVAFTHATNVTGIIHPVADLVREARAAGAYTVVDGAQAIAHTPTDLTKIGCDAYVFSSHKLYGPTGSGCLVADHDFLNTAAPLLIGGGMINTVTTDSATWAESPIRHEAGTPNSAGIAGTVAALLWLSTNQKALADHERELIAYTHTALTAVPELTLIGPDSPENRGSVFAFNLAGRHAHDVAQVLADQHIAIRSGKHCTQPLHDFLGIPASARISIGAYTTKDDINTAVTALKSVLETIPKRSNE